jgi:hypothetical protein
LPPPSAPTKARMPHRAAQWTAAHIWPGGVRSPTPDGSPTSAFTQGGSRQRWRQMPSCTKAHDLDLRGIRVWSKGSFMSINKALQPLEIQANLLPPDQQTPTFSNKKVVACQGRVMCSQDGNGRKWKREKFVTPMEKHVKITITITNYPVPSRSCWAFRLVDLAYHIIEYKKHHRARFNLITFYEGSSYLYQKLRLRTPARSCLSANQSWRHYELWPTVEGGAPSWITKYNNQEKRSWRWWCGSAIIQIQSDPQKCNKSMSKGLFCTKESINEKKFHVSFSPWFFFLSRFWVILSDGS